MSTEQESRGLDGRVAVVTGGGGGIGTEVSRELARRGATVVIVDPGLDVRGLGAPEPAAERTASLIRDAGGSAKASTVSVTDLPALRALFAEIVAEHGSLDIVVHAAGILRPLGTVDWGEDDWAPVLNVHFDGYRNVLSAALPIMTAAGYGRVIGFTSGAGLARTSVSDVAYGSAKRAIADLTWAIGGLMPAGVSVNCLSPIAATRMVAETLVAIGADKGALDLSDMPQPQSMAPAAAFLASEEAGWFRGQVLFSAGTELSLIAPPRLIEVVRTSAADGFGAALNTLVPVVLAPAERAQESSGGSNPRFHDVFAATGAYAAAGDADAAAGPACLIVGSDNAEVAAALRGWGLTAVPASGAGTDLDSHDFGQASEALAAAVKQAPSVSAVIVDLPAAPDAGLTAADAGWQEVIADHAEVTERLLRYASWVTEAVNLQRSAGTPLRILAVVNGDSPADRTVYQGVAQMARSFNDLLPPERLRVFALARTGSGGDPAAFGDFAARLLASDDTIALGGAELIYQGEWLGIMSHPRPASTLSFGGPALPSWAGGALREMARR